MALVPPTLPLFKRNSHTHFPIFTCHFKHTNISRRAAATTALTSSLLLAKHALPLLHVQDAIAFDFRMTVPDQTVEEAESAIQDHAQSLLQVKALLESSPPEDWKDARKALRKSSSYVKQDLYTLIQSKPGSERPRLRKLYSDLFNSVTGLDYAARDKDSPRVWECYGNIVVALNDILSRI